MPIKKQMNKTLTRHVYSQTHMGLSNLLSDYVLMIIQQSQHIKVSLAGCDDTCSPNKLNDHEFEANLSSQKIPIINTKQQQLNVTLSIYWGKTKDDKVEQMSRRPPPWLCPSFSPLSVLASSHSGLIFSFRIVTSWKTLTCLLCQGFAVENHYFQFYSQYMFWLCLHLWYYKEHGLNFKSLWTPLK